MKMISILMLIFATSAFGMKFTEDDSKKFQVCMKEGNKLCEREKDEAACLGTVHKRLSSNCQKLIKKATTQMAHMGSSCTGIVKLCPMKYGTSEEGLKKFEDCVRKNMKKMPKSCQQAMTQMYEANTGKKTSFKKMMKDMKKGQAQKSKGQNVKVQNR